MNRESAISKLLIKTLDNVLFMKLKVNQEWKEKRLENVITKLSSLRRGTSCCLSNRHLGLQDKRKYVWHLPNYAISPVVSSYIVWSSPGKNLFICWLSARCPSFSRCVLEFSRFQHDWKSAGMCFHQLKSLILWP